MIFSKVTILFQIQTFLNTFSYDLGAVGLVITIVLKLLLIALKCLYELLASFDLQILATIKTS